MENPQAWQLHYPARMVQQSGLLHLEKPARISTFLKLFPPCPVTSPQTCAKRSVLFRIVGPPSFLVNVGLHPPRISKANLITIGGTSEKKMVDYRLWGSS